MRDWLRDKRAQPLFEMLRDKSGLLADLIHPGQLDRLLQRNQAGQEDCSDRLWRLLNLQLWGEMYLTGRRSRWWDGMLAPAAMPSAV